MRALAGFNIVDTAPVRWIGDCGMAGGTAQTREMRLGARTQRRSVFAPVALPPVRFALATASAYSSTEKGR